MKVTIVSSIYGAYDTVKHTPEQTIPVDYVMVSDQQTEAPGWQLVVEPRPHLHPCYAAKIAKCLPWRYAPDADVTIWVDGAATIISREFAEMCVDAVEKDWQAQWVHPERDDIGDECVASRSFAKYADQPMEAQVAHYRQLGHPRNWGMWATGCIVRRRDDVLHERFGSEWLVEQARWTFQDQLSEPFLIQDGNYPEIAPMPERLWSNQWLAFGGHAR